MVAAALVTESVPLPSALAFPRPVLLVALVRPGGIALPGIEMAGHLLGSPRLVHGRGSDPQVPRERYPRVLHEGRLYLILVVGLLIDPAVRGVWRRATGSAAAWLFAMIAWSVVLSIPMAFVDWRIPFIALKLDWQYVPLVIAGYLLASENDGVRRLLTGFVILGIPACLVGIIQAQFGPDFLRPTVVTEASQLLRLDLTRTHDVFQPTGTFVDAGRFGSHGDADVRVRPRFARPRPPDLHRTGASLRASSESSWRRPPSGLTQARPGSSSPQRSPWWRRSRRRSQIAGSRSPARPWLWRWSGAVLLMFVLFPQLSANRVAYLSERLDPRVSTNEWQSRINSWTDSTIEGLRIGGVTGAGTGPVPNGLQYLGSGELAGAGNGRRTGGGRLRFCRAAMGVHRSVAVVGLDDCLDATPLAVSQRSARGTPFASVGLLVTSWVVIFLFVSFVAGFQVLSELLRERLPLGLLRDRFRVPGHSSGSGPKVRRTSRRWCYYGAARDASMFTARRTLAPVDDAA